MNVGRRLFVSREYLSLTLRKPSRGVSTFASRFLSSERVPSEDYYEGHLLANRLEYLDDMLDKTLTIGALMEDLKKTHAEKRIAYKNSASLEEMEKLFLKAENHKLEISSQLETLKVILLDAKSSTSFAVDGPDGTPDGAVREGLNEVASQKSP